MLQMRGMLQASPPPRVCSTKTRIKTLFGNVSYFHIPTPRVCSTKTRIKTEEESFLVLFNLSESMFH